MRRWAMRRRAPASGMGRSEGKTRRPAVMTQQAGETPALYFQSATTASAARLPATIAPCSDGVSRWSPQR